jgi:hypothetical protein
MQEVNENEYRVGCTHCILYESSGISLDWAHGKVFRKFASFIDMGLIITSQIFVIFICNITSQ